MGHQRGLSAEPGVARGGAPHTHARHEHGQGHHLDSGIAQELLQHLHRVGARVGDGNGPAPPAGPAQDLAKLEPHVRLARLVVQEDVPPQGRHLLLLCHVERDRALVRRFQKVEINEPSHDDCIKILEGLKEGDEVVTSGNFLLDSESRMRAAGSDPLTEVSIDPICKMEVEHAKAMAAVYLECLGNVDKADRYFTLAGPESRAKLEALFE